MFLLASCANPEATEVEDSLNQSQAAEKMNEHIMQAADEIQGEVELSAERYPDPIFSTCEGEPGGENHTVSGRHTYWIDGVPNKRNEEMAEAIHAYWSKGNWSVISDERPQRLEIQARNKDDLFRMKLVFSQYGRPSLSAYSPCVRSDDET